MLSPCIKLKHWYLWGTTVCVLKYCLQKGFTPKNFSSNSFLNGPTKKPRYLSVYSPCPFIWKLNDNWECAHSLQPHTQPLFWWACMSHRCSFAKPISMHNIIIWIYRHVLKAGAWVYICILVIPVYNRKTTKLIHKICINFKMENWYARSEEQK